MTRQVQASLEEETAEEVDDGDQATTAGVLAEETTLTYKKRAMTRMVQVETNGAAGTWKCLRKNSATTNERLTLPRSGVLKSGEIEVWITSLRNWIDKSVVYGVAKNHTEI
jgi:hypothetical protein